MKKIALKVLTLCLKRDIMFLQARDGGEEIMRVTLKAARVNKGYTLEEAAKKIGIGKRTLLSYEKGATFPNQQTIDSILRVYDAGYDDIIFLPQNYA